MSSFDPWSVDYFNPPLPHVPAPSPKARAPKPVPDPDALFTVQRHALDLLHDIQDLERAIDTKDRHTLALLHRLERDAENAYRVIRSYLHENVAPDQ